MDGEQHAGVDARLHRHLWTSCTYILRAYTGAHGLNSTHHAVVEVGLDEIVVRVDTRWLRFTHTGMTDSNGQSTPFALLEDGTVKLGQDTEEIDFAAERLAREMMHS